MSGGFGTRIGSGSKPGSRFDSRHPPTEAGPSTGADIDPSSELSNYGTGTSKSVSLVDDDDFTAGRTPTLRAGAQQRPFGQTAPQNCVCCGEPLEPVITEPVEPASNQEAEAHAEKARDSMQTPVADQGNPRIAALYVATLIRALRLDDVVKRHATETGTGLDGLTRRGWLNEVDLGKLLQQQPEIQHRHQEQTSTRDLVQKHINNYCDRLIGLSNPFSPEQQRLRYAAAAAVAGRQGLANLGNAQFLGYGVLPVPNSGLPLEHLLSADVDVPYRSDVMLQGLGAPLPYPYAPAPLLAPVPPTHAQLAYAQALDRRDVNDYFRLASRDIIAIENEADDVRDYRRRVLQADFDFAMEELRQGNKRQARDLAIMRDTLEVDAAKAEEIMDEDQELERQDLEEYKAGIEACNECDAEHELDEETAQRLESLLQELGLRSLDSERFKEMLDAFCNVDREFYKEVLDKGKEKAKKTDENKAEAEVGEASGSGGAELENEDSNETSVVC